MNLVLERLADKTTPVDVIVTADTRGNYIEHMIKRCGGNALRVPDGYKAFGALKNIVRDSYEKAHSIAVALDGPLGPRHEPKKLAFYLSEHAEEAFVGISLSYSSCIRLTRRWDKYVIPLPFTTVDVAVKDYGIVQKKAMLRRQYKHFSFAKRRDRIKNTGNDGKGEGISNGNQSCFDRRG